MNWPGELDLDTPVTVCVTHLRFIPCRAGSPECRFSGDPADVERVRAYQRGEE